MMQLRLFLCGDVMTGRGIDQALPQPVNPALYEPYIRDARDYLELAERANGPIPRPVDSEYIWGDALPELDRSAVDLRIVNLETAITAADSYWSGKKIHYRMHPRNIGCLSAARIDACALANNHVLDWGYAGLLQTLQSLRAAHIAYAGAGNTAPEAAAPALFEVAGKEHVLLFSFGSVTGGIPPGWRATVTSAGVNLLDDLSEANAVRLAREMRQFEQPGDLLVVSIHWGGNWGHEIPRQQSAFAHRLIEEGVAVVHGHSSHHPKAIEVFKDHLILYGCGDFIADYEGISGCETFRSDLVLMYLVELDLPSGRLKSARLVPFHLRRFRLERASVSDAEWIRALLNREGALFGTRVRLMEDNSMTLDWLQ